MPLEFQAVPVPKIAPLWMNLPRFRQLCQGNYLDIIFSCPYELHELTAKRFLSRLFFTLSDEQKEVLYYLFVKQYSTTRLAAIRGQSDRNIRKLRMTIQKKLQRRMYEHLSEKLEKDYSITLREREFVEEYEALLQTMGKDAMIRRENKTKPRKKENRNLYRKGMAAFGGIAPSYHIELLDNPTIYWDFHSLLLGIQMMFSFLLVDGEKPLRLCKHCQKVFLSSRSNSAFCSPRCKNQYNVYKSRGKKTIEED